MNKSILGRATVAGLALAALTVFSPVAPAQAQGPVMGAPPPGAARTGGPVIYVRGQDLYYDSIVLAGLPNKGPFQKLEMGAGIALETDFGPGDMGFVGGRWWIDANANDEMDDEDVYFLCPLLGPGREAP
jgi:hypothetical protein